MDEAVCSQLPIIYAQVQTLMNDGKSWIDLYGKRQTTRKTYKGEVGTGSSSDRRVGSPQIRELAGFAPVGLPGTGQGGAVGRGGDGAVKVDIPVCRRGVEGDIETTEILIVFACGVAAGLLAGVVKVARLKRQLTRLRREQRKAPESPAPHGAVPGATPASGPGIERDRG